MAQRLCRLYLDGVVASNRIVGGIGTQRLGEFGIALDGRSIARGRCHLFGYRIDVDGRLVYQS